MANLIRNTPEEPTKARLIFNTRDREPKEFVPHGKKDELVAAAHRALAQRPNTPGINQASFHIQAALGAIRDDPVQDVKLEKWKGKIYHHLYVAMNELVAGPGQEDLATASPLLDDLADVMGKGPSPALGGGDVPAVPEVQQDLPTTPK